MIYGARLETGWERGDPFPCTRNRIRFHSERILCGQIEIVIRKREFCNLSIAGPVSIYIYIYSFDFYESF